MPKAIQPLGRYKADPGTAGSTTLLLQVALPILLFAPPHVPTSDSTVLDDSVGSTDAQTLTETFVATLSLLGGTNATFAPQIDYTVHVFLPFLRRHLGLEGIQLDIVKRGYYPRGGGEVRVLVPPITGQLPAFTVTERGSVLRVRGKSYVAGVLPLFVAQKTASGALDTLRAALPGVDIDIEVVKEDESNAVGSGSGIVLWAETDNGCVFGGSEVGKKGRDARKVGDAAAIELLRGLEGEGCVDEYLQASCAHRGCSMLQNLAHLC